MLDETLLPHSNEAEQALLASIIIDELGWYKICDLLNEHSFYKSGHQKIYDAIKTLKENGSSVDILTISQILQDRDQLVSIGGVAYLSALSDHAPVAANAPSYAKIIANKKARREIIIAAEEIQQLAFKSEDPITEILGTSFKSLLAVQTERRREATAAESSAKVCENIISRQGKPDTLMGITTGFKFLDDFMLGFRKHSLITLAANSGLGKTTFALNMAVNMALKGVPVLYFSLEMSDEELMQKVYPMLSKGDHMFTHSDMTSVTLDPRKLETLNYIHSKASALPLYFEYGTKDFGEMMLKIERHRHQHGIQFVIVDYLQIMNEADDPRVLTRYTGGFKDYCMINDTPIMILSQLNRNSVVRDNKKPTQTDLKGSGSIAADADVILFLHKIVHKEREGKKENYFTKKHDGETMLILDKFRQGNLNDPVDFPLSFVKEIGRYLESA